MSPPAPHPSRRVRPRRTAPRRSPREALLRALTMASGAVLGAALTSSPLLHVRQVRVLGCASLPGPERAQMALSARVPPRTNLFKAPTGRIGAELCRLPWVASASVRRRIPGTLEVIVHPRQTVALLMAPSGPVELDAGGIAIRRSVAPPPVPKIVATIAAPVRAGLRVGDAGTQTALAIARWSAPRTHGKVLQITVDQGADLCLNTDDDMIVRLGQPGDLQEKLALLARIYTREPGIASHVREINLMSPKTPACTPRGEGQGVSVSPAVEAATASDQRGAVDAQPGEPKPGAGRTTP